MTTTDRAAATLPLHAAFLLLAHDPATGRALVDDTHLKPGLAGAALLELARTGALRLEGEGRHARLVATGVAVPAELAEAVRRADGRPPKDGVGRLGGAASFTDRIGALRQATWAALQAGGSVAPREHKVLGLFPTTRWLQVGPHRERLVADLRRALGGATPVDPDLAALAGVAKATGLLRRLYPDVPRKQLDARAEALAGGMWGGPAVARAISDIQGAIVAATVASTTAVVASSG